MASVERGHTVVHHASFSFSNGVSRQFVASHGILHGLTPTRLFTQCRLGGSTAHVGITLGASRRGTIKGHPRPTLSPSPSRSYTLQDRFFLPLSIFQPARLPLLASQFRGQVICYWNNAKLPVPERLENFTPIRLENRSRFEIRV